ncbi:MAG: hypothetical protein Q9217_005742 [Psora testacea]
MESGHTEYESAETNGVWDLNKTGCLKESIEVPPGITHASYPEILPQNSLQQDQSSDCQNPQYQNGLLPFPVREDGYDSCGASQVEPASSVAATEEHRIQAFAKLEFADGDFYMTTYAIELGRDRQTASPVQYDYWRGQQNGSKNQSTSSAAGSFKLENDGGDSVRDSIEGNNGVDTAEPMHNGTARPEEVASNPSSSQPLSRKSPITNSRKDYNALAMTPVRDSNSAMNGANMDVFDLSAPLDCPLIPIQQPLRDRGRPVNKKSISRRHARISFNFEKHYFELLFLGRNGGFLDEEWFAPGDIQPLVNGSVIQIGGLGVRFILPDVPPGETGADEIENGDYDDESVEAYSNPDAEDSNDDEPQDEPQDEEAGKITTRGRGKSKPEQEAERAKSKRKGPGRPPKNGVMSKREQAQLAREAREKAKNVSDKKAGTTSGRGKGKSAKALELEKSSIQPSGKRKYTKRKRANGENGDQNVRESTEMTDSAPPEQAMPAKPPKEKKPPKPPRSPSPQWDESTLTPEQLAKPQASYVILIHEALTNSRTGAMSLPQIYRAIERKYPYFKLKVTTQGWQSSVRHNLGQHAAFRKIERDGKGWMWGYDPEISIEKEKKRRATPPPTTHPPPRYYPQQSLQQPRASTYRYPGVPFTAGQLPPNGQMPSNALPPMGYSQHPSMSHSPLPPHPLFGAPGYPMILNANSESNYRSPYDPNSSAQQPPQSSSHTQPKSQPNGVNRSQPLPPPQPSSMQPHYPNYQPTPPDPFPTLNSRLNNTSPHSQPSPLTDPGLSPHVLAAIDTFKSALMEEMDDKDHAEGLIQSAIDRTLGRQHKSFTSQEDIDNEKAVMDAVQSLLQDLDDGDKDERNVEGGSQTKWAEGEMEAKVDEMAKNAAKLAAADAQTEVSPTIGVQGETNGLKHERSPNAEGVEEPPGKKKSM